MRTPPSTHLFAVLELRPILYQSHDWRTAGKTSRSVAQRVLASILDRVSVLFALRSIRRILCVLFHHHGTVYERGTLFHYHLFGHRLIPLRHQTLRRGRRSSACSEENTPSTSSSADDDGPPPIRTVLTRRVLLSVANYGALAFADIAFIAFLPLFLSTPIALGGLGLAPAAIGTILGALGVLDGLWQAVLFAPAVDAWGAKRVYQVGAAALVPIYVLFPMMNAVARASGEVTGAVWALVLLQLLMVCIMDMAYGEL